MSAQPPVHIDRLMADLEQLATFSDAEPPAVTRIVYSEADQKARTWLKQRCADADLSLREDAIGNLFARWSGTEPDLPAVATGSHIDAIPHSGKYDGTVGVLGGLEAIRALKNAGVKPRRSIELLMFTSEEPTRFGLGCLGSRALSGSRSTEAMALLTDSDRQSLEALRQQAGFGGSLSDVRLKDGRYAAFVELHIEQGPILERDQIPIGIVTAIAAPAALRVQISGTGGHAGSALMPGRQDALCAAAELVLAVEAAADGPDAVATTGVCRVHPGAINSIPSQVTLEIDVRNIDLAARDQSLTAIRTAIESVSACRGVRTTIELLNADPPADMATSVIAASEDACRELSLPCRRMVSRAYHDSLFMAQICPTGMIFIPCRGGISHRPDEYAAPADILAGVEVLAATIARLAGF